MTIIDKLYADPSFFPTLANDLSIRARRDNDGTQDCFGGKFCTYGASHTFNGLKVQAVFWDEATKKIAIYPVLNDAISFNFTGCIMARFRICETYYVAHIHTDRCQSLDCRKAWADFVLKNKNIIDELIMFKPGSKETEPLTGKCHGIITRCGQCYTIMIDPNTNRCSKIHLHRQTKKSVEGYKEILELAHNQCDYNSFLKMRDRWELYWNSRSGVYDNLSANETDDQIGGGSCCILI